MRIAIHSDLHLEFPEARRTFGVPGWPDADVVVAAGDICCPGERAPYLLATTLDPEETERPILYVPGNHEFYGCEIGAQSRTLQAEASALGVHLLQRDVLLLGGRQGLVRFIGAILWTDYCLPVDIHGEAVTDSARAMVEAARRLNDHRRIQRFDSAQNTTRRFTPADALAMHHADRQWLREMLQVPFDGPTVVITHHAPRLESVHARYRADWLSPAFASHLDNSFFEVPVLWIHGHTHDSADYMVGNCRVISNPRGYPKWNGRNQVENDHYDPALVVEIDSPPQPKPGGAGQGGTGDVS